MLPRKYIVPFSQRLILANDIHCPARSRVRGNQPVARPTKKPTNLSQSGEVPKGGRGLIFGKKCSDGNAEGRDVKGSIDLHF